MLVMSTEQFLEKKKDYVVTEHQALLGASRCTFIADLFPTDANKQSKFSCIASQFKQQLASLLEGLSTTEPHYIRCVEPNNLLKPCIFENQNSLQQLRCGGVMETMRVCRATRKRFDEFLDRFSILASASSDEKAACKKLLETVGLQVFLKAGQMAELDDRRSEVLGRAASIIQWKFLTRKSFIMLRNAATNIQAVYRGQVARYKFEALRREAAALKIQRALRIHLDRRRAYIEAVVTVESGLRGMATRDSHCCRLVAELHYKKLKNAIITTQSSWRARKEVRMLKMAAKSKLEKQVEELTWRLQLEKRMRTDVEESKTQENAKLQLALEEIQGNQNFALKGSGNCEKGCRNCYNSKGGFCC